MLTVVMYMCLILGAFGVKEEDGGWNPSGYEGDPGLLEGPCNIDVFDAKDLTQEMFLERYAYKEPVVIRGSRGGEAAHQHQYFRQSTSRPSLLHRLGSVEVRLSAANTHSYERKDMYFGDYCDSHMGPQDASRLANETYYLFGENTHPMWQTLLSEYPLPPYSLPGHSPMLSFGLAGPGSGVPFHFHGPGFAETLWGRKRWFLSSPSSPPSFHPDRTPLQWLQEGYSAATGLRECTIRPGEMIYFPNMWWHATLNLDPCVFMSTFLSP